jgi:hypothetical protein
MAQAVGSVQTHVTFIPPATFSILKVHRGTMTMFGIIAGLGVLPIIGPPMPDMPVIPFIGRSIIIVPVMIAPSLKSRVRGGLNQT